MALRLAKAGYWGGDPERILKAPPKYVLAALQYENFLSEFEVKVHDLNKPKEPA